MYNQYQKKTSLRLYIQLPLNSYEPSAPRAGDGCHLSLRNEAHNWGFPYIWLGSNDGILLGLAAHCSGFVEISHSPIPIFIYILLALGSEWVLTA